MFHWDTEGRLCGLCCPLVAKYSGHGTKAPWAAVPATAHGAGPSLARLVNKDSKLQFSALQNRIAALAQDFAPIRNGPRFRSLD